MFIKDDIEELKKYAKHTLRWKLREEKYEIDVIVKLTGLTKEEIEELK